jgi:hypothetical protein
MSHEPVDFVMLALTPGLVGLAPVSITTVLAILLTALCPFLGFGHFPFGFCFRPFWAIVSRGTHPESRLVFVRHEDFYFCCQAGFSPTPSLGFNQETVAPALDPEASDIALEEILGSFACPLRLEPQRDEKNFFFRRLLARALNGYETVGPRMDPADTPICSGD